MFRSSVHFKIHFSRRREVQGFCSIHVHLDVQFPRTTFEKTLLSVSDVCACVRACVRACMSVSRSVARQARMSMGFSRQEYWSGQPFPSPGGLPDPGITPGSPALEVDSLLSEPPGKP